MDYYQGAGLPYLGNLADHVPAQHPLGQNSRDMFGGPFWTAVRIGGFVSVPVLAYHGYMRNKSVGWSLVWGIFGSWVWPLTVPIAFAQGYAKPKVKRNSGYYLPNPRRRRRTSRRRRRTSR